LNKKRNAGIVRSLFIAFQMIMLRRPLLAHEKARFLVTVTIIVT
jgi:hypothetical protein